MISESYKTIPGYPDYQVSNLGRVLSLRDKTKPLIMKVSKSPDGRRTVVVRNDESKRTFRLSTLVALVHIGPRPEGLEIAHEDGDLNHNCVTNLSYKTHAENERDKRRHDTVCGKLTPRHVKVIRGLYKCDFTVKRLTEIFNVHRRTIWSVVTKDTWAWVV